MVHLKTEEELLDYNIKLAKKKRKEWKNKGDESLAEWYAGQIFAYENIKKGIALGIYPRAKAKKEFG